MSRENVIKRILLFVFVFLAGTSFTNVSKSEAAQIGIDQTNVTCTEGDTVKLEIYGTTKKVSWSSSNYKIASVDSSGTVTTKAKGQVTITANVEKKKYTSKIKVEQPKINKISASVTIKKTLQLSMLGTSREVTWSSSNTSIATVSYKGIVTPVNPGTVTIIANIENSQYICNVTVKSNVINAKKSYIDYAKEISSLIKDGVKLNSSTYKKSNGVISNRILVKTNGSSIDFTIYKPLTVVAGPDNEFILQFSKEKDAELCLKKLNNKKEIVYVIYDHVVNINDVESKANGQKNDQAVNISDIGEKSESEVSGQNISWGTTCIKADQYADYVSNKTNNTVKVAIVDTGVSQHTMLNEKLIAGYDFIDSDVYATDGNGHGTHVAGIIADCTKDANVQILPVRVLDNDGCGTYATVCAGIRYAVENGADVINLSLGGCVNEAFDTTIVEAVEAGVVVVAAAGNDNEDTMYVSPAHLSECIVVAATDSNNNVTYYSNYGDSVDVAAPGDDIVSCSMNNGYTMLSGTSMATPHVTAVAAMLIMEHPTATTSEIETLVKEYTTDYGSTGWDIFYGCGINDLSKAIPKQTVAIEEYMSVGDKIDMLKNTQVSELGNEWTWNSSNEAVATVNENGIVNVIDFGTCTIIGENSSSIVQCNIESGECTYTENIIDTQYNVGDIRECINDIPSGINMSDFEWNSNDEAVAIVDSNGTVTFLSEGNVEIIGNTNRGRKFSIQMTTNNITNIEE